MKPAYFFSLILLFIACNRISICGPSASDNNIEAEKLTDFELRKTCFEVGRRLYEAEFKTLRDGSTPFNPLYTYSKELNTCVMYAGFLREETTSNFLIDVLSNRDIASSIQVGNKTMGLSKEEFERRKKSFFPDIP